MTPKPGAEHDQTSNVSSGCEGEIAFDLEEEIPDKNQLIVETRSLVLDKDHTGNKTDTEQKGEEEPVEMDELNEEIKEKESEISKYELSSDTLSSVDVRQDVIENDQLENGSEKDEMLAESQSTQGKTDSTTLVLGEEITEKAEFENGVEKSETLKDKDVEKIVDQSAKEKHIKQEAELQAYLESLKPKPKRKSIKEMLMSMPGYKDIMSLKPKIGGAFGEKKDVIFLDDESIKKEAARDLRRRQQIDALMERFVRHAIPPPQKTPKEQAKVVKLKIKKKEEDSQGLEHLVENEVEYVRNPLNEDEEAAMNLLSTPHSKSPQTAAPGVQRRRLQEVLLTQIRTRKRKEFEERRKVMAMYNDEVDEEDKEEIIEDDENSSDGSDFDEDEEEEVEYLLSGSSKKKKNKCKYVDDEAEDEDEDADSDDDTDESDEDEEEIENSKTKKASKGKDDSDSQTEDSEAEENVSKDLVDCSPSKNATSTDEFSEAIKRSIEASPMVVIPKADIWSGTTGGAKDALWSPLLRVLKEPKVDVVEAKEKPSKTSGVPEALAGVITTDNQNDFGDLADLCSGRFVSQVDNVLDSQEDDDEYAGFDCDGDDDFDGGDANTKTVDDSEANEVVKTPTVAQGSARSAVNGITPKLGEKMSKTKLLMQFEKEASDALSESLNSEKEKEDEADVDDDDEDVGIRTRVIRKKKRLHFSDDEDEDVGDVDPPMDSSMLSEEEVEEEDEEIERVEIRPKPSNPFFNKHGHLKRKFVEDEAELSGSEEGSADEDERGLNHYERDEADEEELDEEMVRKQVGKAHLERLLDDDDREIRYLQNTYLENGDLHTDKQRERKFRWMNLSAMDDDAVMGDSDDEPQVDETPEELQKKKEWIEKRKWMSENSHLLDADEDESQSLLTNSRFLKIGKNTLKRIESFVDTSTSESRDEVIKESSVKRVSILEQFIKAKAESRKSVNNLTSSSEVINLEINPNRPSTEVANTSMSEPLFGKSDLSWAKPTFQNTKKGSFLNRGGMMLAKLAETTKTGDALSNVKNNSRNFVFSHITPPNTEKTDGSTSRVKRVSHANKGSCGAQAKKPKIDRSFNIMDERSKGSIFKHFSS